MIQRINIKTIDKNCLKIYLNFILKTLTYFNIKFKYIYLPKKTKKIIFLKSPHVFKKAKEHFKFTQYEVYLIVKIKNLNYLKNLIYLYKPNTLKIKITVEGR